MSEKRWIDLQALHVVMTLAREGGFQAAADALGVSQPTVSYRVKRLEDGLGFEIFRRAHRGPELTERGAVLIAQAQELLEHHDVLRRRVATADEGTLVIGIPEILAHPLTAVLRTAFAEWGELRFKVANSSKLRDDLRLGAVDIAITLGGTVSDDDDSLSRICGVGVGWYAADQANELDYRRDGALRLAVFGPGCPFRRAGEQALRGAGIPFRNTNEVDALSGLLGVLELGDSVTALPWLTANDSDLMPVHDLPEPRQVALSIGTAPRLGNAVGYRVADVVTDRLRTAVV